MVNNLSIWDTFGTLAELLAELGKYILLIPTFIFKFIEYLYIMIDFIPGVFGTITKIFIAILIGFFGLNLIGKVRK